MKLKRSLIVRILLHALAWGTFLLLPILSSATPEIRILKLDRWAVFLTHGTMTALLMAFYYTNFGILAPRYFLKGRKAQYMATVLGCFVVHLVLNWVVINEVSLHFEEVIAIHGDQGGLLPWRLVPVVIFFIVSGILSTAQRIGEAYQQVRLAQKASEKELLQRELEQLRTQMDPHFFFNALNTIYGLAELKDDRTAQATLDLGKLMRRTLEAPRAALVPLAEEVEHLRSYIAFQQLRSSGPAVNLSVQLPDDHLRIAPFLLLPLVENAFKHGSTSIVAPPPFIHLMCNSDHRLSMVVTNAIRTDQTTFASTGMGLANLRRRLNLEYPNAHTLTASERDATYHAHLIIELDHAVHSA
jgi:two-component system, LytTR family, sensor kinase